MKGNRKGKREARKEKRETNRRKRKVSKRKDRKVRHQDKKVCLGLKGDRSFVTNSPSYKIQSPESHKHTGKRKVENKKYRNKIIEEWRK